MGGPPGNLYVVLHVKPHPYFRRRDYDILLNLNINIAQAALGDTIKVPTLEGEEELEIPAGTQTGSVFRLKGKGVPRLQRSGRGDQIIIANVVVPTHLDANQRRLLTELGKTLGSDVTPQADKGFFDRLKEVRVLMDEQHTARYRAWRATVGRISVQVERDAVDDVVGSGPPLHRWRRGGRPRGRHAAHGTRVPAVWDEETRKSSRSSCCSAARRPSQATHPSSSRRTGPNPGRRSFPRSTSGRAPSSCPQPV